MTGASAGVGRATARAFARRGARVALLARGAAGLEAVRRDVEADGVQAAFTREIDVADADAVERAASEIENALGPIDVWVNNAMLSVFSPVREMTAAEYRRVTEVTYLGVVHGTQAALRRMLPRDRGVIVQVGSTLAYRAIPLQSAYCAAKHAVRGFTDSLRSELLHDGSRVQLTMVQLPALNTPQFDWVRSRLPRKAQPVPPIYQPELAAETIVWAAEHPRREIALGLTTNVILWGNKFFPAFGDRYLARAGYDSQMTEEPADPGAPNNLDAPVDAARDHGAHGRFDARASGGARDLWLATHPSAVAAGTAAAALVAAAALLCLVRRRRALR